MMKLSDIYKKIDLSKDYSPQQLNKLCSEFQKDSLINLASPNAKTQELINSTIICVPIYNEENFIPHFTKSLLKQISIQGELKIMLVLNSCTDNTKNILLKTLTKYTSKGKSLPTNTSRFIYKNLNIELIEIKRKGKVLAMKKILKYAKQNKYKYFINLDSDFILQKDTLINLILENQRVVETKENRDYIISGSTIRVYRKSNVNKSNDLFQINNLLWSNQKYISVVGALFLAKVDWLNKNISENITEDYLLGLILRHQGGAIYKCETSRIWGYFPNQQDNQNQISRSIRGRLQIIKKFPYLKSQIHKDNFFMRPKLSRLSHVTREIAKQPKNIKNWIKLLQNIDKAYSAASEEEKTSPNEITWNRLSSTKG